AEPKATQQPSKKVQAKPAHWWRRWLLGAAVLALYFSLERPVMHTTAQAAAGAIDLRQGAGAASQLQLAAAAEHFQAAGQHLTAAEQSVGSLAWLAQVLGQQATFNQLEHGLVAMAAASEGLATTSTTIQPLVEEVRQLMRFRQSPAANHDLARVSEEATTGLRQAQAQFGQALSLLSAGQPQVAGAQTDGQTEQLGQGLLTGPMARARQVLLQAQTVL